MCVYMCVRKKEKEKDGKKGRGEKQEKKINRTDVQGCILVR